MNRSTKVTATWAAVMLITAGVPAAYADFTVTCTSRHNRYQHCDTDTHGYVTMVRQLSSEACIQGRTWDYDRRGIWVDDGCSAEFRVESSSDHHKSSGKHDAEVAAGVLVGAAILGALVNNKHHEDAYKYNDDNYYGSRHTSYVPSWMVGTFRGYNPMYGVDVVMTIRGDGRMTSDVEGQAISGYVNDERLHVGNVIFDLDRSRDGFITSQKGDRHNEVHYRRID